MRKIKFRGIDDETGEYVYAELGRWCLSVKGRFFVIDDDAHYIEPATVSQLIGVDKLGNEIYEGDLIEYAEAIAKPFAATFEHLIWIRDGEIIKCQE